MEIPSGKHRDLVDASEENVDGICMNKDGSVPDGLIMRLNDLATTARQFRVKNDTLRDENEAQLAALKAFLPCWLNAEHSKAHYRTTLVSETKYEAAVATAEALLK